MCLQQRLKVDFECIEVNGIKPYCTQKDFLLKCGNHFCVGNPMQWITNVLGSQEVLECSLVEKFIGDSNKKMVLCSVAWKTRAIFALDSADTNSEYEMTFCKFYSDILSRMGGWIDGYLSLRGKVQCFLQKTVSKHHNEIKAFKTDILMS